LGDRGGPNQLGRNPHGGDARQITFLQSIDRFSVFDKLEDRAGLRLHYRANVSQITLLLSLSSA